MNNLLYNARMALRDLIDVNIFTKGNDRVFLTVDPDLTWHDDAPENGELPEERAQARQVHTEKAVRTAIDYLQEMDLTVAGGEDGIKSLMESEAVEIVRKAA